MLRRTRTARLLGTAFLLGLHAYASAGPSEGARALQALRALDARVATVGHRLATANAGLCRDRQWQSGMLIHHRSLYARTDQRALASAFGLAEAPAVLAVAAGGAAQRAGVRADDGIVSIDGAALPLPDPRVEKSFAPTEAMVAAIEAAFADGYARILLRRAGAVLAISVAADRGCASRFQVAPSSGQAAKADGIYVQVTTAMVEYAQDDDELSALVAHELAHNILRHRARLNVAGVARDFRAGFGSSGRLFRQTELEADRLAVHLMARAGYDPRAAVRLWARQRDDDWLEGGTHPEWSTRIQALEQEIAAIDAARARGELAPAPLSEGPLDVMP